MVTVLRPQYSAYFFVTVQQRYTLYERVDSKRETWKVVKCWTPSYSYLESQSWECRYFRIPAIWRTKMDDTGENPCWCLCFLNNDIHRTMLGWKNTDRFNCAVCNHHTEQPFWILSLGLVGVVLQRGFPVEISNWELGNSYFPVQMEHPIGFT